MTIVLAVIFTAYLLGSIPCGFLVGKLRGVDLRKEGSCNIGATNALRVLGKKWGYLVFAGDTFKGWLAVMASYGISYGHREEFAIQMGVLAAAFTVIGHMFPVWLKFQGGKGIATSAGVMLALFPIQVFITGLIAWLVLFFTTRYVSLASLAAAIALPSASFTLMLMGKCDLIRVTVAAIMCTLAVWRHKPNIQRLLAGTEKRFEKKPRQEPTV